MPKKKHRKKVRAGKRSASGKGTSHLALATGPKAAKRTKHHSAHERREGHSVSLLRAIKRRRQAERNGHHERHGDIGPVHRARKAGSLHHAGKRGHHHAEPVVTEKSFENMLAFRRFQNHAR